MNKKYNIAEEMGILLNVKSAEEATHSSKISLALDYLNKASELLDNLGKAKQSEMVTKVIEIVASKVG